MCVWASYVCVRATYVCVGAGIFVCGGEVGQGVFSSIGPTFCHVCTMTH